VSFGCHQLVRAAPVTQPASTPKLRVRAASISPEWSPPTSGDARRLSGSAPRASRRPSVRPTLVLFRAERSRLSVDARSRHRSVLDTRGITSTARAAAAARETLGLAVLATRTALNGPPCSA
jgi:hypothetical protein